MWGKNPHQDAWEAHAVKNSTQLWGGQGWCFPRRAERPVAGAQGPRWSEQRQRQDGAGLCSPQNGPACYSQCDGSQGACEETSEVPVRRITVASVWRREDRGQESEWEAGKEAVVIDHPDVWARGAGEGSDQKSNLGCIVKVRSHDITLPC